MVLITILCFYNDLNPANKKYSNRFRNFSLKADYFANRLTNIQKKFGIRMYLLLMRYIFLNVVIYTDRAERTTYKFFLCGHAKLNLISIIQNLYFLNVDNLNGNSYGSK